MVPHREWVRRMTPNKSDACRKEMGVWSSDGEEESRPTKVLL